MCLSDLIILYIFSLHIQFDLYTRYVNLQCKLILKFLKIIESKSKQKKQLVNFQPLNLNVGKRQRQQKEQQTIDYVEALFKWASVIASSTELLLNRLNG